MMDDYLQENRLVQSLISTGIDWGLNDILIVIKIQFFKKKKKKKKKK